MLVVCVLDHVLCSSKYLCFVCDPMVFRFSLQISVLFVFMRVEISLFNSGIVGSCDVFFLVMLLCGRSLSLLRILPTGMCCLPAWYSMLVNVFFCVMYVCRWLYCSEGVFCVLCEFVPVCLPVISV